MKISIIAAKGFVFLVLGIFSMSALGYGASGSSTPSCKPPKFSEMTPPKSSVVAPGSEFSFVASRSTKQRSIKVQVKGQSVELAVEKQKLGAYLVTGNLPEEFKEGFVKVAITAKTEHSCAGKGGWLLKIAE